MSRSAPPKATGPAPEIRRDETPESAKEFFSATAAVSANIAAFWSDDEDWNLEPVERDEAGKLLYNMLGDAYMSWGPGKKYLTNGALLLCLVAKKSRKTAAKRKARRLERQRIAAGGRNNTPQPGAPQRPVEPQAEQPAPRPAPTPENLPPAKPTPQALSILGELPKAPLGQ